jgi:hypothetical protein
MSDCSKAIERNWETMIEGEGLHNVPGLELILDGMGDEVRQGWEKRHEYTDNQSV